MHLPRAATLREAFTLIELLVVIAIIAILAVVVVLTLNPAQLLAQSRDANRVSDMATLSSAISLYQDDQSDASSYGMGTSSVMYVSLPDTASLTCDDQGLSPIPFGGSYHCATQANFRLASSSGWTPINFQKISSGAPFGSVPIDPVNSSSSHFYYTYTPNGGGQYEVTAPMESSKYKFGGSGDVISGDGAPLTSVFAKGTNLSLESLDYGDPALVGYWPLNEGTASTTAYDYSGNNATGSWNGTPTGTNGFYSAGKGQTWSGYFNAGAGNYVQMPRVIQDDFTITAWFNSLTVGASNGNWYQGVQIVSAEVCGVVNDFGTAINFNGQVMFGVGNPDTTIVGTSDVVDGNWHFLAATRQRSTGQMMLYVDGALQASTTAANTGSLTSPSAIYFGGDPCAGSDYAGRIQDVRMYSTVLSAAQVQSLNANGR